MNSNAAQKMVVARELERSWSEGGHGAREALYSPDFVLHHVQAGDLYLARFQQLLAGMRAASQHLRMVWHGMITDGDYIAVPYYLSGIFTRDFTVLGIKATGKPWGVNGHMLYRLEGECIAEAWVTYDTMSMALQWGKVPGASEAAPEPPWDFASSASATPTSETRAFIERYFDAKNSHIKSAQRLAEYISDQDIALRDNLLALEPAFPHYQFMPQVVVIEGDLVFALSQFRGTQRGDFMGIPASGREVSASAAITYRVAEGKIVAHWLVMDSLSLMQQISGEIAQPTK